MQLNLLEIENLVKREGYSQTNETEFYKVFRNGRNRAEIPKTLCKEYFCTGRIPAIDWQRFLKYNLDEKEIAFIMTHVQDMSGEED